MWGVRQGRARLPRVEGEVEVVAVLAEAFFHAGPIYVQVLGEKLEVVRGADGWKDGLAVAVVELGGARGGRVRRFGNRAV